MIPSFLLAAGLAAIFLTAARADDETSTIKFSDPAKPGTLRVALANGDVRIHGTDAAEITVHTDLKPQQPEQRKDGLRVLSSSSTYSLTEKANVVMLAYGVDGWTGGGSDFDITVPRNTNIVVTSSIGGDISVGEVTGDVEVKSLNGEIKLGDVTGGLLVETMNGEIHCTLKELHDGKPVSITSMNGEVKLNVPADLKANVHLRTHNGSILTDFDDKQLVTKTATLRSDHHHINIGLSSADAAAIRIQVNEAMRTAKAAMRDAARATADALRDSDDDKGKSKGKKDKDKDDDEEEVASVPPIPPVPPVPPMTGGKLVTGVLNGGGPEIRIATMNGDVTFRKIGAGGGEGSGFALTIEVRTDGTLVCNGKDVSDDDLPGLLEDIHNDHSDAKVLVIGDEHTQAKVTYVMDSLRKVGLNKIAFKAPGK